MELQRFGKAIAAVVYFLLVAAYAALSGDNHIDPDEGVAVAIAAVTAVGVYVIPLAPQMRWGKAAVAILLGVLQVLATVILGGLDGNEWILLGLTAASMVAGGVLPARSDNGVSSARVTGSDAGPPPAL
jgi:hypothetical protein